jgi:hypothetical protein
MFDELPTDEKDRLAALADLAEYLFDFKTREYQGVKDGKTVYYRTNLMANINFSRTPLANDLYQAYIDYSRAYKDFKGRETIDVRNIDDVATTAISSMVSAATD